MRTLLPARRAKSLVMGKLLICAALATLPLGTGCVHVALGRSQAPYQGRSAHPTDEIRLGFALPEFPAWSFAYAADNAKGPRDSASYFAPRCVKSIFEIAPGTSATGCHPEITARSDAVEVQYRWGPAQSVHPVASVALGKVTAGYDLVRGAGYRLDSAQSSPFVTIGGGGEVNLSRWLHITAIAGYRQLFAQSSARGIVTGSGFTLTSLVVVGTPYRLR